MRDLGGLDVLTRMLELLSWGEIPRVEKLVLEILEAQSGKAVIGFLLRTPTPPESKRVVEPPGDEEWKRLEAELEQYVKENPESGLLTQKDLLKMAPEVVEGIMEAIKPRPKPVSPRARRSRAVAGGRRKKAGR